jgi:hypothetical protein
MQAMISLIKLTCEQVRVKRLNRPGDPLWRRHLFQNH